MRIISLTGPDGAGKTTLAEKIKQLDPTTIVLHQGYRFRKVIPIYHTVVLKKAIRLAALGHTVILDRWWHCEYVYAGVHRGGTRWPSYGRHLHHLANSVGVMNCVCTLAPAQAAEHMALTDRPELYTGADLAAKVALAYTQLLSGASGDSTLTGYALQIALDGGLAKVDPQNTTSYSWHLDDLDVTAQRLLTPSSSLHP